jgi:hypothetical protein
MTDSFLSKAGSELVAKDRSTRIEWHDDPAGFARNCINWPRKTGLEDYQAEILTDLATKGRGAVRSPHGTGKTTTESLAVLWFAVTRDAAGIDWKAPITAGAWRQLERYLWPEIHLWARRLRFDRLDRAQFNERNELLTLSLNLRHGSAFAVASNDASLIEGAHAESLLYVFDEAKSIESAIFDAAEGAFAGPGETFALACSTPGAPAGRFYDFHARRPGLEDWHPAHITLEQAVTAGRISQSWAEKRAKQWGTDSALYKNRVLGEFAAGDDDGVIPLPWVEAAIERWQAQHDAGDGYGPATSIGVDVAREGADRTCIALKHGPTFAPLRLYARGDTMQTAGRAAGILRAHPNATAVVDVVGIGAGVFDSLREQGLKPSAFSAGSAATGKDRSGELGFLNLRAEAWWRLREALDPAFGATLALPPDDEDLLLSDLTTPRYTETSRGLIQVERKIDIKKRLGRSTDATDAVVMACYEADVIGVADAWYKSHFLMAVKGNVDMSDVVRRKADEGNWWAEVVPEYEIVPDCTKDDCIWVPSEYSQYEKCLADGCDAYRDNVSDE